MSAKEEKLVSKDKLKKLSMYQISKVTIVVKDFVAIK